MTQKQVFTKIFALIFMATLIFPFGNIKAQETLGVETTEKQVVSPVVTATTTETNQQIIETTTSAEANMDENIEAKDFGVSDSKILPNNAFYQVKSLWQGLRSAFTFNPIKKAELKLQYANENLIEAKKMAETKNNPELVTNALEKYQKQIAGVAKAMENVSEKTKERAANLAEKIIDYSFKQQKLIDSLENKLDTQQTKIAQQAKNQGIESLGKIINGIIPPEQISNKINEVIDNQKGSEFKDFKNLEVLKSVGQKVPEATREAIRQAQQNVLQKLEVKINKLQESEKFQNYIENTGGNKTIQSEIIEEISLGETPQTIAQEPEKAKEQIEKAKNELRQILENKNFEKYLTDLTLIEIIKKHLNEAETAFNQKNFGQAFGQATSGLHQIASLKNLIKKEELQQNKVKEKNKQTEQKEEKRVGMANPASVFCKEKGGSLEIKTDENGGQFGICHLPDGTTCEEWALFRGECPRDNKKQEKTPENKETPKPSCPELSQPICENGIIIPIDKDENGCPSALKCMGLGEKKPIEEPVKCDDKKDTLDSNWCKDGKIVYPVGKDKNGCKFSPICVKSEMEQMPIVGPNVPPAPPSLPSPKPSILPNKSPVDCIQVITPATNNGICKEFPTPCDVPDGWQKVASCSNEQNSINEKILIDKRRQKVNENNTLTVPKNIKDTPSINNLISPAPKPSTNLNLPEKIKINSKKTVLPEGSLGKLGLWEKIKNWLAK